MADFNPNSYLSEVLLQYCRKDKALDQRLTQKRNEIAEYIKGLYPRKCAEGQEACLAEEPFDIGSKKKGTLVYFKLDLDLLVPFTHLSFEGRGMEGHLQSMSDSVHKKLQSQFGREGVVVRPQRVSTRLSFPLGSEWLEIDVVPAMEAAPGTFQDSHKNNALLLWDRMEGKQVKTNVHKQIAHLKREGLEKEKQVIKLLKIYKKRNGIKISSFALELITLQAFLNAKGKVPKTLFDRLKMTLVFIGRRLPDIPLKDPGNKQNDLSRSIPKINSVANRFLNLANRLEENPERLKTEFPLKSK